MQSKRQQILEILKEHREATVSELARALKITSVTVRHHLDVLRSEGLVSEPEIRHRHSVGRPKYVYSLTSKAGDYFPKNYIGLTSDLLLELRTQLPAKQMDGIFTSVAERMAADAPPSRPGETTAERVENITQFLSEKGYMAHWEETPQGYVLHTNNCPYESLSSDHPELCSTDNYLIDYLFGHTMQRVCHMHAGDESCAYLIPFDLLVHEDASSLANE